MVDDVISLILVVPTQIAVIVILFWSLSKFWQRKLILSAHKWFTTSILMLNLYVATLIPSVISPSLTTVDFVRMSEALSFIFGTAFGETFAMGIGISVPRKRLKDILVMVSIFASGAVIFSSMIPGAWEIANSNGTWVMS